MWRCDGDGENAGDMQSGNHLECDPIYCSDESTDEKLYCVGQSAGSVSGMNSTTPFQDALKKIHDSGRDWVSMSVGADQARSFSWIKNMTENGAWGTGGAGRVGPPTRAEFEGFAKLLGVTPDQVGRMVVMDFYGVETLGEYSPRVHRLAPLIDELSEDDADLVESMARRLTQS